MGAVEKEHVEISDIREAIDGVRIQSQMIKNVVEKWEGEFPQIDPARESIALKEARAVFKWIVRKIDGKV